MLPESIPDGQRHDVLKSYAASLRARNVTLDEAWILFTRAVERCEHPETFRKAPETILADIYSRYPAGHDDPAAWMRELEGSASLPAIGSPLLDPFEAEVEHELRRLRIRKTATERLRIETAERASEPLDVTTLAHQLERPAPARWRIGGLVAADGSTLLSAQRKTGKTTLALNAVRSILEGCPFLGRFDVAPVSGAVAFLNFEVSRDTFNLWASEVGVDASRLLPVHLRGRLNPLVHPEEREQLARSLRERETEVVVVDTFTRAFRGASENDAAEVGRFLTDLDVFVRGEVGATDLILTAHTGWNGERSRGSSALEDWPDSIITLRRDADGDDSTRYFSAFGRDVEVEEDALSFDPRTRALSLTGAGSRRQAKAVREESEHMVTIQRILLSHAEGLSGADLYREAGKPTSGPFTRARERLAGLGVVVADKRSGRGGGMTYKLADPVLVAAKLEGDA
ncbi:ATP-binding protein [Beutenbergia cavernae]|uniref:ATP-binding protein n=1 Tax=Beutenbergia cavernae TaxID=84757 RepID=UPI00019AD22E|nr:AAA family ATPase [Beutenbergia cavernae]